MFVLTGEGIECEKEAERFFKISGAFLEVQRLPLAQLFASPRLLSQMAKSGDWIFFPGGFSFADHFGSGRLLAFKLREIGFFEECLSLGLHILGICNGFQVLVRSGLFGEELSLLPNQAAVSGNDPEKKNASMGFVDRWVKLSGRGPELEGSEFFFPVRHAEGRLSSSTGTLPAGVEACLVYQDPYFSNGSFDNIAGIRAKRGSSWIIGLMPHPEIALRRADEPTKPGPDYIVTFGERFYNYDGDGLRFLSALVKGVN